MLQLTMAAGSTGEKEEHGGEPGSLWLQICEEEKFNFEFHPNFEEYELEQPSLPAGFKSRGKSIICMKDQNLNAEEFDACIFEEISPCSQQPNPKTCSPRTYLECFIFPVLLPGMAEMLLEAKKEKCFLRKRTKFIACDFLTQWLYKINKNNLQYIYKQNNHSNRNPGRRDEDSKDFFEIPFVQEWLKEHPRPPIPLSLLLSEEEAAILIQSFWRGYLVRCDPEVQELRQWQKDLRESKDITKKVQEFWDKQETKVEKELQDRGQAQDYTDNSCKLDSPIPQSMETETHD